VACQQLHTFDNYIFCHALTSLTNCFAEYEQETLYVALVVTLAMLLSLISCRFIIIIILSECFLNLDIADLSSFLGRVAFIQLPLTLIVSNSTPIRYACCMQLELKHARDQGKRRHIRDEIKLLRRELRHRESSAVNSIIRRASVVLSTLTTASDDGPLCALDQHKFDIVVIDECSQVDMFTICLVVTLNLVISF